MLLNLLQCKASQLAQICGNLWLQTSFLDLVLADSGTSLVAYSFISGLRLPPSALSLRRDGDTASVSDIISRPGPQWLGPHHLSLPLVDQGSLTRWLRQGGSNRQASSLP